MPSTAHATRVREEQRTERWEGLRLVDGTTSQAWSVGEIAELAGLVLIVLATFFVAAVIFVPQLAGLI